MILPAPVDDCANAGVIPQSPEGIAYILGKAFLGVRGIRIQCQDKLLPGFVSRLDGDTEDGHGEEDRAHGGDGNGENSILVQSPLAVVVPSFELELELLQDRGLEKRKVRDKGSATTSELGQPANLPCQSLLHREGAF